jgi:hypothetical protein
MTLVRSVVMMVSAMALLAACGGKTSGDDLTSTPNPNNPSPTPTTTPGPDPTAPKPCNGPSLACDPGDVSVGSEANCGKADYCYSRTGCPGDVLWCAHRTVQCGAIPRCDQGDEQVIQCPDPAPNSAITCYPRTVCGSTIQCVHRDACTSLPSCQPGDIEVTAISTCSMKGVSCYSVTECNYTIHCYTP